MKAIAKWSGAKPEDVPGSIALYAFPTREGPGDEVAGGGKDCDRREGARGHGRLPALAEADREEAAGLRRRGEPGVRAGSDEVTHAGSSEAAIGVRCASAERIASTTPVSARRTTSAMSKLEVRHLSVHYAGRGGTAGTLALSRRQPRARPGRLRRRARRIRLRQDDAAVVHRRLHAVLVGRDPARRQAGRPVPAPSAASCSRSTR